MSSHESDSSLAMVCVQGLHNTSSELMGLALRTLEIWVDGLKPDCLEHLVAPFKAKLMK